MVTQDALRSDDPLAWDRLIDAVSPAAMLLRLEAAVGASLRGKVAVEDVWRESLLRTWEVRAKIEWTGLADFRRQILAISDEVIRSRVEHGDGGKVTAMPRRGTSSVHAGPVACTSPARAAADRAEANAMRASLDKLTPELRYVVWLSEFEELEPTVIAERLELMLSEVQDRLRRGTIAFRHKLRSARLEKAAEQSEETWF